MRRELHPVSLQRIVGLDPGEMRRRRLAGLQARAKLGLPRSAAGGHGGADGSRSAEQEIGSAHARDAAYRFSGKRQQALGLTRSCAAGAAAGASVPGPAAGKAGFDGAGARALKA